MLIKSKVGFPEGFVLGSSCSVSLVDLVVEMFATQGYTQGEIGEYSGGHHDITERVQHYNLLR